MFPIENRKDVAHILFALEDHAGVFIKDPELYHLGKATFAAAKQVFNSTTELPALDEKTMFPSTINTLPGASRKVIQRYVTRPFPIQDEPLNYLTKDLCLESQNLADFILNNASFHYKWSLQTIEDLIANRDEWVLNVANYPFTKECDSQLLFPAHKDWGLMALYPYIDGPGLEVYINNEWQALVVPEDCLFCYAGDIFTRVSDKRVPALLHRVVQPPQLVGDRTSIIFYADPVRTMVLPNGQVVGDIIDSKLKKIGQIK